MQLGKKKKIYLTIALVIIVGLLITAQKLNWISGSEGIKVSVDEISRNSIIESVTTNGKIQPEMEVIITPNASGEIVGLHVKEGDTVSKGQLLLKIDPDLYQSARDKTYASLNTAKANLANSKARKSQAEAQLLKAEADYNRNKKLYDDKVISESEFESISSSYQVAKAEVRAAEQSVIAAEYNVKNTEAAVKEAENNLVKTAVYSPIDGTVTKLSKELGERVSGASQFSMGTEVMRVANLKNMEVKVDVNENDIVRVNVGDTALIEVDAYLGRKFKGIVSQIANSANIQGTATDQITNFSVKIRILRSSYIDLIENKNEVSPFRPGMSASVEILTEYKYQVVTVPISAVTTRIIKDDTLKEKKEKDITEKFDDSNEVVFVIDGDKVELRKVKVGIQDDKFFEVLEGLEEGEKVVTSPYYAISKHLEDGSQIRVVKKSELFSGEDK
jgi:HlyD family secretion protein